MSPSFEELKRRALERQRVKQPHLTSERIWSMWRDFRGCPDDEESSAYCEGRLSLDRRVQIWWHCRRCTFCRSEISALREMMSPAFPEFVTARPSAGMLRRIRIPVAVTAAIVVLTGSYKVSQILHRKAEKEKIAQEEAQARAQFKEMIGRAMENLGAISKLSNGGLEERWLVAQRVKADAEELRKRKDHWERAISELKKRDSSVHERLNATQAAMNELGRTLERYSKIESALKGWQTATDRIPSADVLLSSSQQALTSLKTTKMLLGDQ